MNSFSPSKVIWRLIQDREASLILLDGEREQFLSSFTMPDKGYGGIQVYKHDVDKALRVLRNVVGEHEYGYCPEGFISDRPPQTNGVYYGKFEVDDLSGLFEALIEADVWIIDVAFWYERD